MYLKSIRAYGFKSFADKLNIELDSNITAVVGPNGSGKSNIVDAIRWVLGEQSIKSLRGSDNMTDVIFTGSKTREPLNRASVSLTFDNNDHYLNCDFNEVEIKRMVYRTGENEYYLNNAKVRLKDITNLFLDTGAGSDSFNIISQGSVQDIINSKPDARRSMFEEAAGVLKYKKRKEESLRKLEKTKDNIDKVSLLVDELENTVGPLKEQAEIAKVYLDLKDKLKNIEIALMAEEITKNTERKGVLVDETANLSNELLKLNTDNSNDDSEIEKLKLENIQLEEAIAAKNSRLLKLVGELSSLTSDKQIAIERQKYNLSDNVVEQNLLSLNEQEIEYKKNIEIAKIELDNLKDEIKQYSNKYNNFQDRILTTKVKRNNLISDINIINKKMFDLENQENILETNLENDNKLPQAVKNILNLKERGVYNTIGKLLKIPYEYSEALEVSLGYNVNFIVVENELVAKKCINYLKNNKLGRATFFPISVIKAKRIDDGSLTKLKTFSGFIGIAADLIKYDQKYDQIVKNQLGNVIVAKDLDSANEIGKNLDYKYRIVSLDGEVIHSGGSITGGNQKNSYSSIIDQKNLTDLKSNIQSLKITLSKTEKELTDINDDYKKLEEQEEEFNRNTAILTERESSKTEQLSLLEEKYNKINSELKGLENIKSNSLDSELITILNKYSEVDKEKIIVEKELLKLKEKKDFLNNELNQAELDNRQNITALNKIQSEIHQKELELNKIDIILDADLTSLSEDYGITYEKARYEYILETDFDEAKKAIAEYKREINRLGDVNTGSIKEYERLSSRYDFLSEQRNDLENSCESLLNIIDEMDKVMVLRFKETYEMINKEFNITFKKLFKGGIGNLKLTDPTDLLKTGIDIVAEPPGKKLNSIGLLSGGEKTLTAIALIFAILNVKTVPFCVFDEVEAALDEANVDMFGEYLKLRKYKSQFILITHKKRTMEYADTLYGITMQESGVSKIVSVKLED